VEARPDGEALLGSVLGDRYHVRQLLGSGGIGHVFLAEVLTPDVGDAGLARPRVALKLLRSEHRQSAAIVERFRREAVAAARVRHPNVLAVLETALDAEPHPFFAMELLVGLDLADTLGFAGRLSAARAVRIASALADALGAAHEAGVIHRDVKPENVFLVHARDGGEPVKLLDFGFAFLAGAPGQSMLPRTTARKLVVGTPEYMAPEQTTGAMPAPTADVYSLGVVLYEMLTGRVPFRGDSYSSVVRQHLEDPVPPMSQAQPPVVASHPLRDLVASTLAKDPAARPSTMAQVAAALQATPEATGRASSH